MVDYVYITDFPLGLSFGLTENKNTKYNDQQRWHITINDVSLRAKCLFLSDFNQNQKSVDKR